jgi:transaldolase/glucose-6-phosphate isomerase
MNPWKELGKFQQSVWLDYIRRDFVTGGELERLIREDGVRGVTSNPSIFEKAIAGSADYDPAIGELIAADPGRDSPALYEELAVADIQGAADLLRRVYDETGGEDGYVSMEISPDLAHDTAKSIDEARRLWKRIDRPNIMIKVPATAEGIPVIETLIAEGLNINATLMFSLSHYEDVAAAYLRGLERSPEPRKSASVASFFVSRVDTAVDKALEALGSGEAAPLKGKIAVANAKMAYRRFRETFSGERWDRLARRGARVQRPLWASTGTKNPAYSDVLYVEELIGPRTVNTVPPATFQAFKDHGRPRPSIGENIEEAESQLRSLAALGIDLNAITARLQEDGVDSFARAFRDLLRALDEKRRKLTAGRRTARGFHLGEYQPSFEDRLTAWKKEGFSRRLWAKDFTLWADRPTAEIADRMGWLHLPELKPDRLDRLGSFAEEIKSEGFTHAVLLGMGGSSLAPEFFQKTFGNRPGHPELLVLDSTHPAAVSAVETAIDLGRTLFIVSSKSGTTLETLSFYRYFREKVGRTTADPGRRFIAITDPGTPLAALARENGFRRLFEADPEVGGRYSALTDFGLVPAALIGMDIRTLLDRARAAAEDNAPRVPEDAASGLLLGAALGEVTRRRNKLTIFTSSSLGHFPAWLEQLIAESTGKDGKGIVPVADEPAMPSDVYRADRFFVGLALEQDHDRDLEARLDTLQRLGHPVIRIGLPDLYSLGKEIFRWEIAIASAGSVIGINPFNQPDVELAKELARSVMKRGKAADDKADAADEAIPADDAARLVGGLDGWLSSVRPGDYIAVQAFLPPGQGTSRALRDLRLDLLEKTGIATTLGYGPRFLHSTGQLHKGGPNEGLFLQIVHEPDSDLAVPGTDYSFGALIRAQALGDYLALRKTGRRVLRVGLKGDPAAAVGLVRAALRGAAKKGTS